MERIYLDNNATTMVDPDVKKAMDPFFCDLFGNPNSLHDFGTETHPYMANALDQIYTALNAGDNDDIIINGCATEGNNNVLKSVLFDLIKKGERTQIITSQIEHPAIRHTAEFLEDQGAEVIFLPVNEDGIVTPDILKKHINPDKTALVSIMWANNETGLINPIDELVKISHDAGALFHTDAVQAVGKIEIDLQKTKVDYLTFSAHKFHGPKGVGGLFIREGIKLSPLLHGGEQMSGIRAGTVNVAFMVAMGLAIEKAVSNLGKEVAKITMLRNKLEDYLLTIDNVQVIGKRELRTPNTILASFKGIEGEAFIWDLNQNGLAASTGSACSSEDLEADATFKAMNVDADLSHTGVRLSLSRFTTEDEIEKAIEIIGKTVTRLRNISSSYN